MQTKRTQTDARTRSRRRILDANLVRVCVITDATIILRLAAGAYFFIYVDANGRLRHAVEDAVSITRWRTARSLSPNYRFCHSSGLLLFQRHLERPDLF
jgi:hypothetical protein